MTKQEIKLKSMLNYLEVDMNGKKDEKIDFLKLGKSFLDILKMSILQKRRPRKSKKCVFWF